MTPDPGNALGELQQALVAAIEASPLQDKLRDARRAGLLKAQNPLAQIDEAQQAGVLTATEAEQLRALDEQVMNVVNVDDFDSSELGTKARRKVTRKRKKTPAKAPDSPADAPSPS